MSDKNVLERLVRANLLQLGSVEGLEVAGGLQMTTEVFIYHYKH